VERHVAHECLVGGDRRDRSGREPDRHVATFEGERLPRRCEDGVTDRVDHHVDVTDHLTEHRRPLLVAVVEGEVGAEPADEIELGPGCGSDDPASVGDAQLDRHRPDPAGCGVDEHRLARSNPPGTVEREPGRLCVDVEPDCVDGVEVVGEDGEVAGVGHGVLGPRSVVGERRPGHAITDRESGRVRGDDRAGQLEAGDERNPRSELVLAVDQESIGEVRGGCVDGDECRFPVVAEPGNR